MLARHRIPPGRDAGRAGVLPGRPVRLYGLVLAFCLAWAMAAHAQQAPSLDCPQERDLCVQAERSGGIDLKSGVAHLQGNVVGMVRSRQLNFHAESLKAYRETGKEWTRLVLEGGVRLRQPEGSSSSDRGVLEKGRIRLDGHVNLSRADMDIQGRDALLITRPNRTVVRGGPEGPLKVMLRRALIPPPKDVPAPEGPVSTVLRADKVDIQDRNRRVLLTGTVRIEQSDGGMNLKAEQVLLMFGAGSVLMSFQADGMVRIEQYGRLISADRALSRNRMRSILLQGNATVRQKEEFNLKSETLEVHTDARKGVIQSRDRQKPITLVIDLKGEKKHKLTTAHLTTLSQKGIPPLTLEKLGPLLDRDFKTRPELLEALRGQLSQAEKKRYMALILKTVR